MRPGLGTHRGHLAVGAIEVERAEFEARQRVRQRRSICAAMLMEIPFAPMTDSFRLYVRKFHHRFCFVVWESGAKPRVKYAKKSVFALYFSDPGGARLGGVKFSATV